jgi:hypothetical protein
VTAYELIGGPADGAVYRPPVDRAPPLFVVYTGHEISAELGPFSGETYALRRDCYHWFPLSREVAFD